jgi:hypothetical protein
VIDGVEDIGLMREVERDVWRDCRVTIKKGAGGAFPHDSYNTLEGLGSDRYFNNVNVILCFYSISTT